MSEKPKGTQLSPLEVILLVIFFVTACGAASLVGLLQWTGNSELVSELQPWVISVIGLVGVAIAWAALRNG